MYMQLQFNFQFKFPLGREIFFCDAMKSFKPKYPNYKSVTACLLVCFRSCRAGGADIHKAFVFLKLFICTSKNV
jgi:hypothetical protein